MVLEKLEIFWGGGCWEATLGIIWIEGGVEKSKVS